LSTTKVRVVLANERKDYRRKKKTVEDEEGECFLLEGKVMDTERGKRGAPEIVRKGKG